MLQRLKFFTLFLLISSSIFAQTLKEDLKKYPDIFFPINITKEDLIKADKAKIPLKMELGMKHFGVEKTQNDLYNPSIKVIGKINFTPDLIGLLVQTQVVPAPGGLYNEYILAIFSLTQGKIVSQEVIGKVEKENMDHNYFLSFEIDKTWTIYCESEEYDETPEENINSKQSSYTLKINKEGKIVKQ